MKDTYITQPDPKVEKKIGKEEYYCYYTHKFFTKEEVKDCWNEKYHDCHGCPGYCDRYAYNFSIKHHTRGANMSPIYKDPLIKVTFSELPEEMKIKRTIINYDRQRNCRNCI